MEEGLKYLSKLDSETGSQWVTDVFDEIAQTIDQRSEKYIYTHTERQITVGSVLFDRNRQIIAKSGKGTALLEQVLLV